MRKNGNHVSQKQWLERVAAILTVRKLVTAAHPSDRWTAKQVVEERGDEPLDMWELGYSPLTYADNLTQEYAAFGPEGE